MGSRHAHYRQKYRFNRCCAFGRLATFSLWQKPPEKAEKQGTGAINQTGTVISSGQSGGVTAGQYIIQSPPVTEQQKEQALASLQSEIEELAHFPNRPDLPQARTLLEQATIAKAPHQLYVILTKYYKPTILSVPKIGKELFDFKSDYYGYENKQQDVEEKVTEEIGKIVAVRLRQGWAIYFRYFLFRSTGHTQQEIKDAGDFLNFSITWEDAERVYNELSKNPTVSGGMTESLNSQRSLLQRPRVSLMVTETPEGQANSFTPAL